MSDDEQLSFPSGGKELSLPDGGVAVQSIKVERIKKPNKSINGFIT